MHWMDRITEKIYAAHMKEYDGNNTQECTSDLVKKVQEATGKEAKKRSRITYLTWVGFIGADVLANYFGIKVPELASLSGILLLYMPHLYYSHLARDIKSNPGMFYEQLRPRVQDDLLSHFSPQGKTNL